MGYQVDHLGAFEVTPPLSEELSAWIDGPLQEDPWEAADERGLELDLDTYCTWWTDGDPTTLQWTGAEKSYDGTPWLQWLLDHVLGPEGHAVTGTVHRFAEPESGFVEASRIHANGAMVTEVYYETDDELPWQEDGPFLGDAFFELSEGQPDEAQQTLLDWLAGTPLADHGGVVAFLRAVADHWPDPETVRAAVDAAAVRTSPGPSASSATSGVDRKSLWDRLLGR